MQKCFYMNLIFYITLDGQKFLKTYFISKLLLRGFQILKKN